MCFKLFKFSKPKPPEILVLPYPEEQPDYSKDVLNTDIKRAISKWFMDYRIPVLYRAFWDGIDAQLDMTLFVISNTGQAILIPAATSAEAMTLRIRPEWCNSGVIAHEFAHISYSQLTSMQKAEFVVLYAELKAGDKWIKLVNEQAPYSLINNIEGHADVYRYLGDAMPETLKEYYPKLIGEK